MLDPLAGMPRLDPEALARFGRQMDALRDAFRSAAEVWGRQFTEIRRALGVWLPPSRLLERPVERARRLRVERAMRAFDRRAARHGRVRR